jgi:aspartyl-tRNA(Asn)/glutamyl-tRNA(Gln) amidotransferase subunit A
VKTSNSDAEFQRDFLTRRDAIRLLGTTAAALVAGSRRSFASDLPNIPVDEGTSPAAGGTSWGTAANLADRIRRRELSATEVCEAYIARIKRDNAALNAFVYLDEDRAREQAHAIDQRIQNGEDPGVFAGVPFAVKDMEDCKGMPTSKGSLLFKGGPPASDDAPHVARVRHAGAVMVGKTATPEFAWSSTTWSRAWGVTRNPWDLDKSPGGSSGGTAAAISSGLIPLATGTDAGGSIRSSAAFTGLVGLKATFG